MSDCFVLYLLLTCMKKKTSGADKFTNNNDAKDEMIRLEELEQARKELDKTSGIKPMKQNMFKAI